jgi:D-inositol-3-phosphate glycosyltransferase
VPPGVDLGTFTPGDTAAARAELGLPADAHVLLFVGRIQPLKAPDVLLKAAADLLARRPALREHLVVAVVGGPSGSGLAKPKALQKLADKLGITPQVRFVPPAARERLAQWYRAADLVAVPSYSESFGLVAVEAQACGTPVVAAAVGGLPTAVGDSGILVDGHDTTDWSHAIESLITDPARRAHLSRTAVRHAAQFSWDHTTERLVEVYAEAHAARTASPIEDARVLAGIPAAVIP